MSLRLSWAGIGFACVCAGHGAVAMAIEMNPVVDPRAVVVSGEARFSVLTPALIRMEWSPTATFEDRASFVFTNRRLPVPDFQMKHNNGWLTIKTDELTLRYRVGGERFNADNLHIELRLNGSTVIWKPGMLETGNLLGTTRTLDGVSGSCPLEKGLISRDGWSVVDDSSALLFDTGKSEQPWATVRDERDGIDWYFFGYGHDYKRALYDYTRLAGRIPLPPRYVFGTWWSRYWAYSDEELRTLVQEFHQHDVPLDVLVVDMDWHLDGWTGYTWNPKYFPDPDGFLKWVRGQNLRTTLNLHPHDGVGKHEAAYEEVARAMGLNLQEVDGVPFDCTDPKYMDAYFKYLHHPKERQGVDFWWLDWQQGEASKLTGLDPLWWLNHLHWADMERNPDRDGKRPLIFSRWGGLGNHRYQVGFSGDTFSNWASLAFQPYFTATAGNVGYAYWSHDIGGHQPGAVDPELYVRWIQYGALSPVLRTHTTKNATAERRIWEFPKEIFHAAREAFRLRYELIPYIYTAARQCYDTAMPLCRPLYYEWPELNEAYEHPGEYLFGNDLLVAPVTSPANPLSQCAEADVWLPPGRWTHWFTGRTYEGQRNIAFLVPLDEIPLFVREGGIIATMPKMNRTEEQPVDPLILHIFPGESGTTRIYEDDGVTSGYLKGQCAWTPVSHATVEGQRRVTIGPVEGGYSGMLSRRQYEIRFRDVWPAEGVMVNGHPLRKVEDSASTGWYYDTETLSLVITTPRMDTSKRLEIAVKPFADRCDEMALRSGLRGELDRLADVAGMLGKDPLTARVGVLREVAGDPRRSPGEIMPLVQTLRASFVEVAGGPSLGHRQALARLLDLVCRMQVKGNSEDDSSLSVAITVNVSLPFEQNDDIRCHAELQPIRDWTITGKRQWDVPWATPGQPMKFETTIVPTNETPQTTVVEGVLHLQRIIYMRRKQTSPTLAPPIGRSDMNRIVTKTEDLIELPIRQVLFPSINTWWVVGPFDAPMADRLQEVYPPERKLDLAATYSGKNDRRIGWQRVIRPITSKADLTDEFHVEFHKVFGDYHQNAVAYAMTWLHAPREMDATLAIGSDDGVVVRLNGQEIHRNDVGRPYTPKEDRVPVRLKQGSNELLVKISQGGGMWGFSVYVETADGQPLPEVKARLTR